MEHDFIIIRAKLYLYPTEEGGRYSPIKTGYRPNHVFEYRDNSNSFKETYIGEINFTEKDLLFPGESIKCTVRFLRHGNIEKFIQIGRNWWIHEGQRKLGKAEILEIN